MPAKIRSIDLFPTVDQESFEPERPKTSFPIPISRVCHGVDMTANQANFRLTEILP